MRSFLKTLIGDAATVAVVTVALAAEVLLAADGRTASATLVVPFLLLGGVAWLATR
jgi:hypothetical protein